MLTLASCSGLNSSLFIEPLFGRKDAEVRQITVIRPGESADATFAPGEAAILENASTAIANLDVTGSESRVYMGYEAANDGETSGN